jgi:3-oxoacyl-[acyl-carrier-protein] synthase-3
MGTKIISIGYKLAPVTVTNEIWQEKFATKQELLGNEFTRFISDGIEQRFYLGPGALIDEFAADAALDCLRRVDFSAERVEHIIHMANVPDTLVNGEAPKIQHRIGAVNASTFDLTGVSCVGFLLGLNLASALIEAGRCRNVLLSCVSNVGTRAADHRDVSASSLGDLAIAALIARTDDDSGQLGYSHTTRGHFYPVHTHKQLPEGKRTWEEDRARHWGQHFFWVDHREGVPAAQQGASVYTPAAARAALERAGKTIADIDWFLTHQPGTAPMQLWDSILGIDPSKHPNTLKEVGNTSFCTIPFTMRRLLDREQIRDKQILLLMAPASGQHSAAMVWRW